MKKKEKFYPVNNQEDEDGCTLYTSNGIIYENKKNPQDTNPPAKNENVIPRPRPAKSHLSSYNHLHSANPK
jgi:hypothetical protein